MRTRPVPNKKLSLEGCLLLCSKATLASIFPDILDISKSITMSHFSVSQFLLLENKMTIIMASASEYMKDNIFELRRKIRRHD